jgi:hypothetical protein
MNNKQDFLDHLQTSFRDYFTTDKNAPLEKAKTKSYINGLMAAGRIFGISFDELQQIITTEQTRVNSNVTELVKAEPEDTDDLEIPTFIRNLQHSK